MKFTRGRRKKPEFVPPKIEEGEVVRYFNHRYWGQLPVVRRKVEVVVDREPVMDQDTGKQFFRRSNREGAPKSYVFKNRTEIQEKEFLWLPINETLAHWVTDFEQSAEEKAAEARREKIAEVTKSLAEGIVDAGLSVSDLVAKLKGEEKAEATAETKTEGSVGEYEFKMTGPGWWQMPDGTKFRGSEQAALEHFQTEYGGVS